MSENNPLDDILQRNKRVETDKAWEISWTRRIIIASGTYIVVCGYLTLLGVTNALFHAAVPAGAYLISTLTLPLIKSFWCRCIYKLERH